MGVDPWEEAVRISLEIKNRMKTEVGDYLTCSIGIADNKLLAKVGSDLKKPDGIVVIGNNELRIKNYGLGSQETNNHKTPNFAKVSSDKKILIIEKNCLYAQLKLTDIPGIGYRQEKNLNALGIKTLVDLKNYPLSHLLARFGPVQGYHLYNMGQLKGSWKANFQQKDQAETIKSMGHMYTLPKEFRKPEFFQPVLYKLCEMVGRRLRKKNLEGNVLSAFIYLDSKSPNPFFSRKDSWGAESKSYEDFSKGSVGGSLKLGEYITDGREIFRYAMDVFKHNSVPFEGRREVVFKLVGVTVAGLKPKSGQLSLFGHREENFRLTAALDKINEKYGDFTIARVPILSAGKVFRDSVGFGRVKEL